MRGIRIKGTYTPDRDGFVVIRFEPTRDRPIVLVDAPGYEVPYYVYLDGVQVDHVVIRCRSLADSQPYEASVDLDLTVWPREWVRL